jgi:bifunctional enzyme CysN/CysC
LLKIGTAKEKATVEQIHRVIDSNSFGEPRDSNQVGYHEVAELELRLDHSIAFDTSEQFPETSRVVLVDGYEIAGGGIVREALEDKESALRAGRFQREQKWIHGQLLAEDRAARFNQRPALVVISGKRDTGRKRLANALERSLWAKDKLVYYLGIGSVLYGVNADLKSKPEPGQWQEHLRRFGEVCHLLLDTGHILIITAVELTQEDVDTLRAMLPDQPLITVWVGDENTNLKSDLILSGEEQLEERVELVQALLNARVHTVTSESNLG